MRTRLQMATLLFAVSIALPSYAGTSPGQLQTDEVRQLRQIVEQQGRQLKEQKSQIEELRAMVGVATKPLKSVVRVKTVVIRRMLPGSNVKTKKIRKTGNRQPRSPNNFPRNLSGVLRRIRLLRSSTRKLMQFFASKVFLRRKKPLCWSLLSSMPFPRPTRLS